MGRVKTKKFGIIHFFAQCWDCEWSEAIDTNEINRNQKVRNKIYKHVRETGHTVKLETGNATDYYLD